MDKKLLSKQIEQMLFVPAISGVAKDTIKKQGKMYAIQLRLSEQEMQLDTAEVTSVVESENPFVVLMTMVNDKFAAYKDSQKEKLKMQLIGSHRLEKELNHLPLAAEEEEAYIREFVGKNVVFYVDTEEFLKQQYLVDISLGGGDLNFGSDALYPSKYGEKGKALDPRSPIVWLAKQQGYSSIQLWKELQKGPVSTGFVSSFLCSIRAELSHITTKTTDSSIMFLVKMTLAELIAINQSIRNPGNDYMVLDKGTCCGIHVYPHDHNQGPFIIRLEKDVRIPIKNIFYAWNEGSQHETEPPLFAFGIMSLGFSWKETLKELHVKKRREKTMDEAALRVEIAKELLSRGFAEDQHGNFHRKITPADVNAHPNTNAYFSPHEVEKICQASDDMLEYKLQQLRAMLDAEESASEPNRFGAHLSHWAGTSKPINIDTGALRALISYYESKNR